jgi:SAM-dependent methyltransferase
VIASLALHHIPTPARRLRLFRRVRAALRPGGVLISADHNPPSHPRLAALARADSLDHLEASYTPSVARGYLRTWAREDHYSPLNDELSLLRRAGFHAEIAARRMAYAVIAAS